MKKVKIVHRDDVEAKVPFEGVFSKRIMTKIKDGSDKMSFNHVKINAGWDQDLLNEDKDEIIYFLDGKRSYPRMIRAWRFLPAVVSTSLLG